jgi:hypothetical protein
VAHVARQFNAAERDATAKRHSRAHRNPSYSDGYAGRNRTITIDLKYLIESNSHYSHSILGTADYRLAVSHA